MGDLVLASNHNIKHAWKTRKKSLLGNNTSFPSLQKKLVPRILRPARGNFFRTNLTSKRKRVRGRPELEHECGSSSNVVEEAYHVLYTIPYRREMKQSGKSMYYCNTETARVRRLDYDAKTPLKHWTYCGHKVVIENDIIIQQCP